MPGDRRPRDRRGDEAEGRDVGGAFGDFLPALDAAGKIPVPGEVVAGRGGALQGETPDVRPARQGGEVDDRGRDVVHVGPLVRGQDAERERDVGGRVLGVGQLAGLRGVSHVRLWRFIVPPESEARATKKPR